jgi:hypothetical protein
MLGSWTFTTESINRVFPYIFLLLFSTPFPCFFFSNFSRGNYRVFWWIQSKIDQNLALLIKIRGCWIKVNNWKLLY